MKKFIVIVSTTILMLLGLFCISSSAARYTGLPITMNQSSYSGDSMFTLSDIEIYVYSNTDPLYTHDASIYLEGTFNKGSKMTLVFYCYDKAGNHLKTFTSDISKSDDYYYINLDIPDVTAAIEIGTAYPGSWSNTYFHCKYINVYSTDGRSIGIPELMLPVYEKVGWHYTEMMYSLDGRSIEVPYCDIAAYKKVGWYLWEDYRYLKFKSDYQTYLNAGKYSNAFYEIEYAASSLKGTYYEKEIYSYKTKLMDLWRKKVNCPIAYCSSSASNGSVSINFRNVSYKTVKAFKIQFDCFDIFGAKLDSYYTNYHVVDFWLNSTEAQWFTWNSIPSKTDHIGNLKVTQVVYSDGTSWYR